MAKSSKTIISFNVKILNGVIKKKERVALWIRKPNPIFCCLKYV